MSKPTVSADVVLPRMQRLTIVAQDPLLRHRDGTIVTAEIEIPAERIAPGPQGHRVHVVDYDASTRTLYRAQPYAVAADGKVRDPFAKPSSSTILHNPGFHAQNVYAITMRTLWQFEFALGRHVPWSSTGQQLKIAPHAFADANAFYSADDEGLMFGYFPGRAGTVFTCLSHDVVAHETTHALVDGLRTHFTDPSSLDQAAFHEGFADIVALLSIFSLPRVIAVMLGDDESGRTRLIPEEWVTRRALAETTLSLAEEMGTELAGGRGRALRASAELKPSRDHLASAEFQEPHRRGEIIVAAMLHALLGVWIARLNPQRMGRIVRGEKKYLDRSVVIEEGARIADYLLTMAIRALDYTPCVHLEFGDFLSAMLTADHEIRPDDGLYSFREHLLQSFRSFGIEPASDGKGLDGRWKAADDGCRYDRVRFEALRWDPVEMFRFVWENQKCLGLYENAYCRVERVQPCLRVAPEDGFHLRETVAECVQKFQVRARELRRFKIRKPDTMPDDLPVFLEGGATLVFDESGRLKYRISNSIYDPKRPDVQERQSNRLAHLWNSGYFRSRPELRGSRFAALHRMRGLPATVRPRDEW